MSPSDERSGRRYKVRGASGKSEWVDHNDLWRLQQLQIERIREERRRRLRVVSLAAVVLVAVVLAVVWLTMDRAEEPGARALPEPALAGEAAATVGEPAAAAAPRPTPEEEIGAAVAAWAAAWGRQDVGAYLACYSADFRPADGSRRAAWERRRRRRLERPAFIRLDLGELEIDLRDAGRAEVRFRQSYSSPDYSDVVRKTLTLAAEEGGWRIVGELAEPLAQ